MKHGSNVGTARFARAMIAPTAILLTLLLAVPIILSLYFSLTKDKLGSGFGPFIGLQNYIYLAHDPAFWLSLSKSVIFTVVFVVFSTFLGLAMAVIIEKIPVGQRLLQVLLIIPWATPWLVVGILWNRFVVDTSGISLARFLVSLNILEASESLLAKPLTAFLFIVVAAAWRQSCFSAILFLAAFKSVDPTIVEAGQVDGATSRQRFWRLIMPVIRPVTATIVILNVIFGFLQFDVVYAMTGGGPAGATKILPIMIYETLYAHTKMGTGTALSMILAVVALAIGFAVVKLSSTKEQS